MNDSEVIACIPLDDHSVGIKYAPNLVGIPVGSNTLKVFADQYDWPTRGPEFNNQRSVIKLAASISYDGGLKFTERVAIRSWGEKVYSSDNELMPTGFIIGVRDIKNPNRVARIEITFEEPLKTQINVQTATEDRNFDIGIGPKSVAFGSVGSGIQYSNASTFSYTIDNSGTDRFLVVASSWNNEAAVLSVTHDGNTVSSIQKLDTPDYGTCEFHGLVAPNAGSKIVAGSFDNGGNYGVSNAVIYEGVDQSTPHGTPVTDTGNNSTASVNVTVATGEMAVSTLCWEQGSGVASSNTQRSVGAGFGGSFYWGGLSDDASTGTVAMTWTGGIGSAYFSIIGMALHASGGGGGGVIKTINGLAIANIKTINGLAVASVKIRNGLAYQ